MRLVRKILKKIHNFILMFGIDISFVKKNQILDTIHHNSEDGMDSFWESHGADSDWNSKVFSALYIEMFKVLSESGIELNNKDFADVGCGNGNLMVFYNQNYSPAMSHGYEFSLSAIKIAQKRLPSGKFFHHDIYNSINIKYSLIFCTEVLEHLLYPDKAAKNISNAMKKDSVAFITVPDGRKDTWTGHVNFWSPESWEVFIHTNFPGCKISTGHINKGSALFAIIKTY
jgi:2-polyprenyl-3-methyl-5-hydroxy-6-metoxy-1,4-benzoquinol methylase